MENSVNAGLVVTIVVNWKAYSDTAECLASLRGVTYPRHQTIVIDNDSDASEADALRRSFPGIELICNDSNEGFARACNQGIHRALLHGASFVLLLNNDALIHPDAITKLVDFLQQRPNVGIAGPLISYHGTDRVWFAGGRLNLWTGRTRHVAIDQPMRNAPAEPGETEFITGCALMARAALLDALGALDERYFAYFEDVELCHRARAAGYSVAVVPEARVAHKVSASAGHRGTNRFSDLQAYLLGRNRTLFARERLHGLQRVAFVAGAASLGALEVLKRGRTLSTVRLYLHGMCQQLGLPACGGRNPVDGIRRLADH